jgi:hypothetical protein
VAWRCLGGPNRRQVLTRINVGLRIDQTVMLVGVSNKIVKRTTYLRLRIDQTAGHVSESL